MGYLVMIYRFSQLYFISMMSGYENEKLIGFVEGKGLLLMGMFMDFGKGKGIFFGQLCSNNIISEDEEFSFMEDVNCENFNGINGKKGFFW